MFSNLTIRTKLFVIALSIALVMLFIGAISYYFLNRVSELWKLTNEVRTFSNYVLEASRSDGDFVRADQTNPDFFELGTSESIKRYNKFYNLSIEQIRYLKSNPTIRDYGLGYQLETIDKNFRNYKQQFTELQAVIKEKGYIGFGLIGRLRSAAKRIEGLIKGYTNPLLHKEMILTLRGYEKNFLVRKEMRYHKKFLRLIEAYRGSVAIADPSLGISESQRAILLAAIDTYREVFETIVGRQQKIGLTLNEGLIGESKRIIDGIEKDVTDIVKIIEAENEKAVVRSIVTFLMLIGSIAVSIVIALSVISSSITDSIQVIKDYVMELVQGKLPQNVALTNDDEIAEMAKSLNIFVESLREKAHFAQEIGKGQFDANFRPLSHEDRLGDSLVEMRERLRLAQEERIVRKQEDDKLNWTNKGLAKFGEILRSSSGDIEELSTEVIEQLVNYIDANQGGIFIHTELEDNPVLSLVASYAYDRRKFIQKIIPVGEGLIGACALEMQRVYLTNLPKDYIEVTSGLGDAPPNCLLIVPLVVDQELMGILELASFYPFEEYQIGFVEKVGENIASSLRSAKITERTNLLLEQFQAQSEELASQEAEMRHHLQELKQTQEEAALNEQESRSFLSAINNTVIKANYSQDGIIVIANDLFTDILGYSKEEILGNHFSILFDEETLDEFSHQWKIMLTTGKAFEHTVQYRAKKGSVRLIAKYSVLFDNDGAVTGILFLAHDITALHRNEKEVENNYLRAQELVSTTKTEMLDLQKQVGELRMQDERNEHEKSTFRFQIEELKQKEQGQDLKIVKLKEEKDLLKLKNKRHEFNEGEQRQKSEQAQKRLNELETRTVSMAFQYQYFERAFDLISVALIITSMDQEIIYINSAAKTLLGQDYDLEGQHCSVWGSSACMNEDCSVKKIKSGLANTVVNWEGKKIELEAFALIDDEGQELGYLELLVDVSDLMDVEQRIQREQGFFKEVINAMPDNVAFKDLDGRFLMVNQAMVESLNVKSMDSAIGRSMADFMVVDEDEFESDISELETGKVILNHLERKELRTGGYKWLQVTKVLLRNLFNNDKAILEVSRDVTEDQMKLALFNKIEQQKINEVSQLKQELGNKDSEISILKAEIEKLKGNQK